MRHPTNRQTRAALSHDDAAHHHENAAHHHREAARHRDDGNHSEADRHHEMADFHGQRADAYAQSAARDTEQNAVYGRGNDEADRPRYEEPTPSNRVGRGNVRNDWSRSDAVDRDRWSEARRGLRRSH